MSDRLDVSRLEPGGVYVVRFTRDDVTNHEWSDTCEYLDMVGARVGVKFALIPPGTDFADPGPVWSPVGTWCRYRSGRVTHYVTGTSGTSHHLACGGSAHERHMVSSDPGYPRRCTPCTRAMERHPNG